MSLFMSLLQRFGESERSLHLVAGLHVADVCLTFFCYAFMLFGVCAGNFFLVNIAIPSQCVPKKAFRYTADGVFHDVSQS